MSKNTEPMPESLQTPEAPEVDDALMNLITTPAELSGVKVIELDRGIKVTARYLTSCSLAKSLADKTEARSKFGKGQAFKCKLPDGTGVLEVKASEDTIGMACMIETLVIEPKMSFTDALILAENHFTRFCTLGQQLYNMTLEEVAERKNDSEPVQEAASA